MLSVEPIKAYTDNYIWLVSTNEGSIVVDPGESKEILNLMDSNKIDLKGVVITHHHYDHTNGLLDLVNKMNLEVYGPKGIEGIDNIVKESDKFSLIGIDFEVIEIPGHTMDHLAFYSSNNKDPILFCGDTLFAGGCGRVFEGSMEQMWSSLLKLRDLPDDTLVYCGHEYTSSNARFATYIDPKNKLLKIANEEINKITDQKLPTVPFELGKEKYINPFLRADNNDFTSSIGLVSNIPSECFSYIRKQKDNF